MKSISIIDKYFLGGFLCLCLYMLPYIIYGEDSFITIHDHLDSSIAHFQNIKNNELLYEHHGTVPILCGIDRVLFSSYPYLELKIFFYSIMPMYWAIISACFLWKVTAFVGMYLLLKRYIVPTCQRGISFFSAIMFSLIPFYVDYSLSSAGMPLLFYAYLNLLKNEKKVWLDYLIITYVGLNSSLALCGFFAIIAILFMAFYYYRRTKNVPFKMLKGLVFLTIIYFFTNFETLQSLFIGGDFISHRAEFSNATNTVRDLDVWINMLVLSQYHAGTFFSLPILLAFLWIFIRFHKEFDLYPLFMFSLVVIAGALIGVLGKLSGLGIFSAIQFDRFYFLFPSLCIVLFAKVFSIVVNYCQNAKKWLFICGLLIVIPFIKEYRCFVERLLGLKTEMPSYSHFYDVELFNEIKSRLTIKSDYSTKVVCLGLFPAVAEYNGLYTLDSYFYNYPLEYKHKFRKTIAEELGKSTKLKNYYDQWGSRCYIFSSELGLRFLFSKNDNIHIEDLSIDINNLKSMGCSYLLSSVPIDNYASINMNYVGNVTTSNSYWNIYIYQL